VGGPVARIARILALAHRAACSLIRGASLLFRCAALLGVFAAAAGCSGERSISPPEAKAHEVSLALFRDGFALAWHGGEGKHDGIYVRLADARGRARGPAMRITDAARSAYEPDLAAIDDNLIVAWYETDSGGELAAYAARIDAQGARRWQRRLSPAGVNGRNTLVRVARDRIWVAWLQGNAGEDPEVYAAVVDAKSGAVLGSRPLAPASRDTWNLNAATDDAGRLHIVYDARLGTRAKELQRVSYDGDDVQRTMLGADDGFDSQYPDLALQGADAALTWFDQRDGNSEVYLAAGPLTDLDTLVTQNARRVTQTPGASIGAYLAWSGERLGVAWCDDTPGQDEIFLQSFDARAQPLGGPMRMTDNPTESLIPAIRPWREGFALAWTERTAALEADASGHAPTVSSVVRLRIAD
jgi:hypothetical protein